MLTLKEWELLDAELPKLSPELRAVLEKLLRKQKRINPKESSEIVDLPGEEWKWIHSYEGLYQISTKGRVKSFISGKATLLKTSEHNRYIRVMLFKDGEPKRGLVHRLVAEAFIPNPENKPQVDHIDSNKTNNCVENLRWATGSENTLYAIEAGVVKIGADKSGAKLTEEDVKYIRAHYIPGHTEFGQNALARKLGVTRHTICQVLDGKTWKHVK